MTASHYLAKFFQLTERTILLQNLKEKIAYPTDITVVDPEDDSSIQYVISLSHTGKIFCYPLIGDEMAAINGFQVDSEKGVLFSKLWKDNSLKSGRLTVYKNCMFYDPDPLSLLITPHPELDTENLYKAGDGLYVNLEDLRFARWLDGPDDVYVDASSSPVSVNQTGTTDYVFGYYLKEFISFYRDNKENVVYQLPNNT